MSAQTDIPSGAVSASVPHDEQTASHPAGSALPEGGVPATEKPEVLVGAAFAGGFVAALLLRKIVG